MGSEYVGMALGEAISSIGRQIGENSEWDRRRKLAQEDALKDLQERLKIQKQAAIDTATLSPPQERTRKDIDATGKAIGIVDEWKIDPQKGTGAWIESRRQPLMVDKAPEKREVKVGTEIISQEFRPDGTWAEIGRAPRAIGKYGRSGGAQKQSVQYKTAPHPDDPNKWVSVAIKDGVSEYVRNKEGGLTVVAPPYRQRKGEAPGVMDRIASSLDSGVKNLTSAASKYAEKAGTQVNQEDLQILQQAKQAIASGRDPNAVRRRLSEAGLGHLADKI